MGLLNFTASLNEVRRPEMLEKSVLLLILHDMEDVQVLTR